MVKFVRFLAAVACVGVIATGCGPPAPPWRINAAIPKNVPIYSEDPAACNRVDTVVLAQCTESREYAKTVRGDWERHWCVTRWQVVRVERGRWSGVSVDFVSYDSWPTPESGIVLRTAPPVYYRGALMAFCIDTAEHRPVIVAQEPRSRIPPHGKLRWPAQEFFSPGSHGVYDEVIAAATRFAGGSQAKMSPRQVVEEYDDFYVVEMGDLRGTEVVTVEKGSYRVQPVLPAYR